MFYQLLFLLILVLLNAFFAASEIAIISLNDNKIKKMGEEGHKKALLILKFLKDPSKFLATIQIGITLAGFLASAFASQSFAGKLVALIKLLGLPIGEGVLNTLSITLITLILSYVTLVFGELVPKRIAMQKAESIAMFAALPLTYLFRFTRPFVAFLSLSTNFFMRLLGANPAVNEEKITEEEIRLMVDAGQEKGVIPLIEKEMIHNIFEFDNTDAAQIMTHRTDIVGISLDEDFDSIMNLFNEKKFSRIPVYEGTIDHIIGILYLKDVFPYLNTNTKNDFSLEKIMRKPYFIPESIKNDDLFLEMQKNRIQMAVVIDDFGGTAGIVTIEDLLEEIVGNLFDEYDTPWQEIEQIDENTYLFAGEISLDEVEETLDLELPTDEYDTLSGFILGQLGRIPGHTENPSIQYGPFVFSVEKISGKRILKVQATRNQGSVK
ncbi:hemolysin family protein [Dehalobacterium formicoaceticum]|uniref:Hemolysin family protein n=1 Tax=Dehalobacterium formicoaceticum TaxID=51515 RepID=A0ABT1Y321_9FIRM|nr:hemolysin family protein [Dehalobacterium formicoaceticum]MCR6544958.1 hemolysin family protein [Dehalobacterium formicoaceticum]